VITDTAPPAALSDGCFSVFHEANRLASRELNHLRRTIKKETQRLINSENTSVSKTIAEQLSQRFADSFAGF
jgi:hypothetical protein